MFGIPIILNPIYFIPTVFAPVISGLVAWVSWATFLGQYTFNPAMSLLPFVKVGDKQALKEEQDSL